MLIVTKILAYSTLKYLFGIAADGVLALAQQNFPRRTVCARVAWLKVRWLTGLVRYLPGGMFSAKSPRSDVPASTHCACRAPIGMGSNSGRRSQRNCHGVICASSSILYSQLLEFAVKVSALQFHRICHFAHVAARLGDVIFKIKAFKIVAQFTQWSVKIERHGFFQR